MGGSLAGEALVGGGGAAWDTWVRGDPAGGGSWRPPGAGEVPESG